MDSRIFSYVVIPIIVLVSMTIAQYIRRKFARPAKKDKVQTPGRFDRWIAKLMSLLAYFTLFFTIMGAIAGEIEMTIAFAVLTLIFFLIVRVLKRAYDMSYQENEEYFILRKQKKEYKVFYEDIVDWEPAFNEINILDRTAPDKKYIQVNVSIFRPEILLRKIAEMTIDGKFAEFSPHFQEDPNRENQLIGFLRQYNYVHILEELNVV